VFEKFQTQPLIVRFPIDHAGEILASPQARAPGETMSNVLFIKGHPATAATSVPMQLADHFLGAYKTSHPSDLVSTVDLYQNEVPLIDADVLDAWNKLQSGHPNEVTPAESASCSD
jgi:FMN-dependent NADH-azoreductase